jgi:4a-hydroxytetrahydrobiopterin dehydratase
MSEPNRTPLDTEAIEEALKSLPGWAVEGGMAAKTFSFKTYQHGLTFAVSVGWQADKLDHHPDILIGYRKVKVSTVTHDAGGLTGLDFALASQVEQLAMGAAE